MKTNLMAKVLVFTLIAVSHFNAFSQIQIGNDLEGIEAEEEFGGSLAITDDGTRIAVGARLNDEAGDNAGYVQVFDLIDSVWTPLGDRILGTGAGAWLYQVSLSTEGNRIAIGAYKNSEGGNQAGSVRVFDWDGSEWSQVGTTLLGENPGDFFGFDVSLSGDGNRLAVGSPDFDKEFENDGLVKVYDWDGSDWIAFPIIDDFYGEFKNDKMGLHVALSKDGNHLAAYAASLEFPNDIHDSYVRIFKYENGEWSTEDTFSNNRDGYGRSIAWSGDGNVLGIGASNIASGPQYYGQVDIFHEVNGNWVLKGPSIIGAPQQNIGTSLALSEQGDSIATGSVLGDDPNNPADNEGMVYFYNYDSSSNDWQISEETIGGVGTQDRCSEDIAMTPNGKRIAVGSTWNDSAGENAGHVRVFDINIDVISSVKNPDNLLEGVSIYPNPTSGQLIVELDQVESSVYILLRNSLNQIIQQKEFELIDKMQMDINAPQGLYYLEVRTGEGKVKNMKVLRF